MNLLGSIRIALRAISANKLRAGLTMLGMIIGVAAVITMVAIGRGAQASVTSQIESMGTNLLFIRPGVQQQGGVASSAGTKATLTYEDAVAINDAGASLGVTAVSPEQTSSGQLLANGKNTNTRITGTSPEYSSVRNANVAAGDFISKQNIDSRSSVIVLGSSVATTLFDTEDPIGKDVKISINGQAGITFKVIGVMESKGGSGFGNQDDMAFVPLTTMQQKLASQLTAQGTRNISTAYVQVTDDKQMNQAIATIGDFLRARHHVTTDDFTIQAQADILSTASSITGVLTLLLGAIAGISLVVGGIGIMNIMLVSVTERTREVGLRKAIGAKRKDILSQFLVEAIVVSVAGGGLGVMLGFGLARLISSVNFGGTSLNAVVSPDSVLLSVGVSAAIGVFFGSYPAFRASRLNPIEALRYE